MKRKSIKFIAALFVVFCLNIVPCVQAQNIAFDGIVTLLDNYYEQGKKARKRMQKNMNFQANVLNVIRAENADLDDLKDLKTELEDIRDTHLVGMRARNTGNSYVAQALTAVNNQIEIKEREDSDSEHESEGSVETDSNVRTSSDEEEIEAQMPEDDQIGGGGDMGFEFEVPVVSQEPVSQEVDNDQRTNVATDSLTRVQAVREEQPTQPEQLLQTVAQIVQPQPEVNRLKRWLRNVMVRMTRFYRKCKNTFSSRFSRR